MKKALAALFLFLCALPAFAQLPSVSPSQLAPHWGFVRKGHCAASAGENCGSNPPTWPLTVAECGTLQSTSNARNADGSTSTAGVRFTLPTVAALTAAGYVASGLTDTLNREGQCEISFVMGLPAPDNYLRIGMDGVSGTDKLTFISGGAFHDLSKGDVTFRMSTPGVIRVGWNGTSWLPLAISPGLAEQINMGQISSHGQGRLFLVTADPTWWTVGTKVGSAAYCPLNGLGTATGNNTASALIQLPTNCVFHEATTGSSTEWLVHRYVGSFTITGIAQGDAYIAGTAPNGTAYLAGNYVRLTGATTTGLSSGNTVEVHNITTANGTVVNGKWIAKVISATEIQLHESVIDFTSNGTADTHIGPPSSFVALDTATSIGVAGSYSALVSSSGSTARQTNSSSGLEVEGTVNHNTVVGLVRRVSGAYTDSTTSRLFASYFNPFEKKCQTTTASDRTATSTTFAKINVDMDCGFVFLNGASTRGSSLGDIGRGVRYTLTVTLSNNTANDGCEIAVGFDGVTAEPEVGRFMNGANVEGAKSVTITGIKTGLTESNHTISALIRAVTGGTCTAASASSNLTAFIWQ